MRIFVNGEPRVIADGATLADLITELKLTGKRIAVEVNREIVPHGHYEDYRLAMDDKIEIVHAIGGGQADPLVIAGRTYRSRFLIGTGKYKDLDETRRCVEASGAEIVTIAIRRSNIGQDPGQPNLLDAVPPDRYTLLPNT